MAHHLLLHCTASDADYVCMCVLLLLIPQVNIPHLLHYAASFDHDNDALIIGHVIDGVWTRVHGFSGGAGMLISRKALSIFGCALSTGTMPLPPQVLPRRPA